MTAVSPPDVVDRVAFLDRVATAPISWGVCEVPGWGHQLPPSRVLREMHELGFRSTELGSDGWLPADSCEMVELLREHCLTPLAAFVPLVVHDATQTDTTLGSARAFARHLQQSGARYFNTAPVTSTDWEPRRSYSDAEWAHLVETLAAIDAICTEHGVLQVVHEHVGCVIETNDDIARLVSSSPVKLVLDTGHMAVGGCDPLTFAREHAGSVGLVHLKDVRLAVAARLNAGELTLMQAVQEGLFPALGHGDLPISDIIIELERAGFCGHYVIEQDCAITGDLPELGSGPMIDVAQSLAFIAKVAESLANNASADR